MFASSLLSVSLALSPTPSPRPAPLACRLDTMTDSQRQRHRRLSEGLAGAVSAVRELPNGYEVALDLSRIHDASGLTYGVVEVAEWVELESRCCPFIDFGIDASGSGGPVRLRLTGTEGVKAVIASEVPMLEKP